MSFEISKGTKKLMEYEITFLPVGKTTSGDAIAIRYGDLKETYEDEKEQTVIVIDGGYQEDGEKLVKHLRENFKTGKVDVVISTHPDQDHSSGLKVVLEKMEVGQFWIHKPSEHSSDTTKFFREEDEITKSNEDEFLEKSMKDVETLLEIAKSKGIEIVEPYSDEELSCSENVLVLGPTRTFYEELLLKAEAFIFEGVLGQNILKSWNIETLNDTGSTSAANNSSVITLLKVENSYFLFTGDAGMPALEEAIYVLKKKKPTLSKLDFVQVPHHGSKNNVGPTVLNRILGEKVLPREQSKGVAFVSSGKEDQKHPSQEVVHSFRLRGFEVYATQCDELWFCSENSPNRKKHLAKKPLP